MPGRVEPIERRMRMLTQMIGVRSWGGALRFDPQQTYAVDDLVVLRSPQRISVWLGGREILLPTASG